PQPISGGKCRQGVWPTRFGQPLPCTHSHLLQAGGMQVSRPPMTSIWPETRHRLLNRVDDCYADKDSRESDSAWDHTASEPERPPGGLISNRGFCVAAEIPIQSLPCVTIVF